MLTFTKMKKSLSKTIEIPEGVEILINENSVSVKGSQGEVKREINFGRLDVNISGNKVILKHDKATKREKKTMNTSAAHISNMIKGVQDKIVYLVKIASGHFPMTVKVEGDTATIKNFLGEKVDRKAKILPNVEIDVKKDLIEIKSVDKEAAGQTAANLESATRISNRDRRIFQDGLYIIKKGEKEL